MDLSPSEKTNAPLYFGLSTGFFVLFSFAPTITAARVLSYLVESGFQANISYLVYGVFLMTPLLAVELLAFLGMVFSSRTPMQRGWLIPAACLLAFDATLLLGFAMNASPAV